jgi:hypothetical protein
MCVRYATMRCMGAAGIRRRKKRRKLPEPEHVSPGDVNRLFGRFTWGTYSPAGTLERNGFFWRQLSRRHDRGRGRDGQRILGYVLWALVAIPTLLGIVWVIAHMFD